MNICKTLLLLTVMAMPLKANEPLNVILDADTANEVDDLYAVTRALITPKWQVTALNATQWEASHWSEPDSMEQSHRLNQLLAGHLKVDVLTRRGGMDRMYDWGDQAQHSAAAYEIIKQAKQLPEGKKLTVVALGALTNVASAIFIEPSIENKLSLYWLGSDINFETKRVSHIDFNCTMDTLAYYKIMNSQVDLHIMPLSVAHDLQFSFKKAQHELLGKSPLGDFLVERWIHHIDSLRHQRTIWDLALVSAMITPTMAELTTVKLKGEFEGRTVTYFSKIDAKAIEADFYHALNEFLSEQP